VYQRQEKYDRAIADFDQAIKLDPKSAIAFANRGWTYLNKREYDRAIADLDKATALDSNLYAAYTGVGRRSTGWAITTGLSRS